jgi:hypothetical protein
VEEKIFEREKLVHGIGRLNMLTDHCREWLVAFAEAAEHYDPDVGETPLEAFLIVERLFDEVLDRNMGTVGAVGWMRPLMSGELSEEEVEEGIRRSDENRRKSEYKIRDIFVEMLFRDPGPPSPADGWLTGGSKSPADNGALAYVDDLQMGVKTEAEIRTEIENSEEYKEKHKFQAARRVVVRNRWLREPDKPSRNLLPLGQSLFYALGGMSRLYYQTVIDNLAGKVNEARFNMSTLGWDDEGPDTQIAPAVVPFKMDGGFPNYWGYSNKVDPKFLDEMEVRLDYAVSRGVRPQLTLLWGGSQKMFVKSKNPPAYHEEALRDFLRATCERLKDHPAVTLELYNEINHGDHLNFAGRKGRQDFVDEWGRFIKQILPDHLLSVSGENVDADGKEGGHFFAYNDQTVLDFWNTHFDRSQRPTSEGFPPWVRSAWHLNELYVPFRQKNPGQGYGRNDEPIFLQTREQHQDWPYGGATIDLRLYGTMLFVCLSAGVPPTIHNQSGFLCGYSTKNPPDPNFPNKDPIYKVAKFYQEILTDFPIKGIAPKNAGWTGSPVRKYDQSFKAFSLVGGNNRRAIIIVVLEPKGSLMLDLDGPYTFAVHEITGDVREIGTLEGNGRLLLPTMNYKKCAIIRLDRA